ncbi:CoA ester lyase [Nocardioides mesophilus]|uniref:CoA ester lyase n=1 Tax=Nocardioides mesophilus TaxID=433659 RepID=A0A7G9RGY9_9ACTN|nr:CoA ester lyase [Nocardioides mesophilus]
MEPREVLGTARTLLFVPGTRPDRFARAGESGADLVVIDLEDAVAPAAKDEARKQAADWLATRPWGVRINPPGTDWFDEDLRAVSAYPCVVMVPKAESATVLGRIAKQLAPGSCLLALVETAAGIVAAPAIARVPAVTRLAFGSYDLAAQLGVSPEDRDAMAYSRGALVLASAAARLPGPFDGVTGDVGDADRLRDDVHHGTRLGLTGKLCVHPRQVPVVHEELRPSEDELVWAGKVVAASAGGGVVLLDGQMVDKPVVERARRMLRAGWGA